MPISDKVKGRRSYCYTDFFQFLSDARKWFDRIIAGSNTSEIVFIAGPFCRGLLSVVEHNRFQAKSSGSANTTLVIRVDISTTVVY